MKQAAFQNLAQAENKWKVWLNYVLQSVGGPATLTAHTAALQLKRRCERAPRGKEKTASEELHWSSAPFSFQLRRFKLVWGGKILWLTHLGSPLTDLPECEQKGGDVRSSGSQRAAVLMQTDQKWQANCEQRVHVPEALLLPRSVSARRLHRGPTRHLYSAVGCRRAALKQGEASTLAGLQPEPVTELQFNRAHRNIHRFL